ncbi:MAG: 4Fe-4S binding protein [Candidatus Aminicenantes bacterium]|uniref:Ferredoxin n=1 Tax=Candidatus Saccharicenans subterraneus TaxID=2508984 RepID=A0A3E2BN42_9BACT|nr:4Fe-4S binding protein [Candidatus Aminicenantes bacterium]RFT16026.1 MAG: Ferredoxin [Candidatus Saccharicenans subterraneum]
MKTRTLKTESKRRLFQVVAALGFNLDFLSLLKGNISQAKTKGLCVPALNCYSCPAAVGACPVGALQNSLNALRYNLGVGQKKLGLYVIGSLGLMGTVGGRLPCGWLCPFGLLQELVYKVPLPKIKLPAFLTNLRYLVLAVLVLLLPLLVVDTSGLGWPWFCKWVCPAGTLEAGIVLSALNPAIRAQLGFLFSWKLSLLILFLVWMAVSMRPFCRTVCPLGTILGFFNRVSAFRMKVDLERCIVCNACQKICPVDIRIYEDPDSSQCIRCLKCEQVCPTVCISHGFRLPESEGSQPAKVQP